MTKPHQPAPHQAVPHQPAPQHYAAPAPYSAPQPPQYVVVQPAPQQVYLVAQQAAPAAPKNSAATSSLILGIFGLFFALSAWVPFVGVFTGIIGLGLGIPAILTGYKGAAEARKLDSIGSSAATTGVVLGWIAVGFVAVVFVITVGFLLAGFISVAMDPSSV